MTDNNTMLNMESGVIRSHRKTGILLAKVGYIHHNSVYVDSLARFRMGQIVKEVGGFY